MEVTVPGRFWGTCALEQAISLQADYNRTRSQICENRNRLANPKVLYYTGSGIDEGNWGNGIGEMAEVNTPTLKPEYARQRVQVFKPNLDDRYAVTRVASHDGLQFEAEAIETAAEILEKLRPDTNVVAIDEAQFFDWAIADVARMLADRGLRVIVTGLDLDFRDEPFGPMPVIMAQAEKIDKLQAICMICGEPASRTQRLINGEPAHFNDPVVIVGAAEMYEARCREHHVIRRG